ncbi:MAG TPA: serine/threonine-protein kinase [Kofleriaceae bacterium]|nr:serine/threonine-protein kinase [Kofleriaceae bacterium]
MGGIHSFSSGGAVYRISRCIGRGGMGEVYLGLQEGIGGLERLVVIKRIYAQFGEDEHFTRMLLEEARLAASIRHPNVVHILDIGRDADGYFLVMEYLSGETLVYITRTLRSRGESVPPAVACRVAADVAAGLECAHTATDPAGQPQPIVHRDVTPSNLIVCFNGVVKIVDFGVAKATLREGHTRGGVKGKIAYLAPEQLHDRPVDGRTDVFQLGICLHELLTGHRLFKGTSDHQRAVAVLEQRIPPPSELDPSLPGVLDEVVLWALERDPARRPASADELRRALEAAAAEVGQLSGHDMGAWMTGALADRLAERTRFERACVAEMREGRSASGEAPAAAMRETSPPRSTVARPAPAGGLAEVRALPVPPRIDGLSPAPADGDSAPAPASDDPPYQPPSAASSAPPAVASGRRATTGLIGLALLLAIGVGVAWRLGGGSATADGSGSAPASDRGASAPIAAAAAPGVRAAAAAPAAPSAPPTSAPAPRTFDVAVTAVPDQAVIELDGMVIGTGGLRTALPVDGTRHILTVRADGYEAVGLDFTDRPPPARVVLDRARAAPARRSSRPVRRSARRERPAGSRAGSDADEPAMTDNPDPWANEQGGGR